MSTVKDPNTKSFNKLGKAYNSANKTKKLKLRIALTELSETVNKDLWRAFLENWQFNPMYILGPGCMLDIIYEVLEINKHDTQGIK